MWAGWEAWGRWRGLDSFWSLFLIGMDLVEDLVCLGPTCKVDICHLPYLFYLWLTLLCWRTQGGGVEGHQNVLLLM